MRNINEYIVNEGFGDALKSFANIFKNIMKHDELSTKDLVTPTLVPHQTLTNDLWEVYYIDNGENKYGDPTTIFTYIGHYDCRKTDIGKLEIDKKYQKFVEKYIEQFK